MEFKLSKYTKFTIAVQNQIFKNSTIGFILYILSREDINKNSDLYKSNKEFLRGRYEKNSELYKSNKEFLIEIFLVACGHWSASYGP